MEGPLSPGAFVNWFGHAAGAVVFGIFLGLLWRDRSPGRNRAAVATLLAFLWNAAELAGLALGSVGPGLAAFESTVFSLLPAVLFDLVIAGSPRWAMRAGYGLGVVAAVLHLSELVSDAAVLHEAGLGLVAAGFGGLALYTLAFRRQRAWPAGALLLLALSSLHFGEDVQHSLWWVELLVHHAGLPLAMYVLLQDYRFVLLDALIRFLANILVALVFAAAGQAWLEKWPATALAGMAGLFLLYAFARLRVQELLTRMVFRRADLTGVLGGIRGAADEEALLAEVEAALRVYLGAGEPMDAVDGSGEGAVLVGDGVEAAIYFKRLNGSAAVLRFGRRAGGRRYLSEDLEALRTVEVAMREAQERLRQAEIERLVARAELRALQAQIHPHFLFNAFNTLYGIIPKEARGARETVLNLADIFRYFLRQNQTFVTIREEMAIIRAYLQIEGLRLGKKLEWEIEVDVGLEEAKIPLLSIEPLVENAVKHGIAPLAEGGRVRLTVAREGDGLHVEVADTGRGFQETVGGAGVGLENVRQRLRLCYGPDAELRIDSTASGTTVSFRIPL